MTNQVADTILLQMGGAGRLGAMIGARGFVSGPDSLQFMFSGYRKFNRCKVALSGDNTYTLGFYRYNAWLSKPLEYEVKGLHFDQLKTEFEEATGLYLTI